MEESLYTRFEGEGDRVKQEIRTVLRLTDAEGTRRKDPRTREVGCEKRRPKSGVNSVNFSLTSKELSRTLCLHVGPRSVTEVSLQEDGPTSIDSHYPSWVRRQDFKFHLKSKLGRQKSVHKVRRKRRITGTQVS